MAKRQRNQKKVLILESDAVERAVREFPDQIDKFGLSSVFAIRAIAQRINDHASRWLAPSGLNAAQHNYLAVLRFGPPSLSLNELSARIHTTNASVTSMIKGLEALGLVAREDDPDDRRSVRVKLTRKGRAVVDRGLPLHYRNLNAGLSKLSLDERRALFALLSKLADGFEEHFG